MECQKAAPTRNMMNLASSHLCLDHKKLDANKYILNCTNGTVDLLTGELKLHDPDDLITKMANVEYNINAKCPRWEAFIEEIFQYDQELIKFIRRGLGYSITGDVSEHVFFICYGTGQNGKSTLTSLMTYLLGDYATVALPGLLIAKQHESHLTEIAELCGARFVPTSEVKTDAKWNEEKIKMLTGGDPISARRMREDPWTFDPSHKFWIPVNHRPTTADNTYGFWRRVKMIPFMYTVPKDKRDKNLPEALKAEMPGILNWLISGCLEWKENGLGSAKAVDEATESYRNPQNDLESFIAGCCVKDATKQVQASVLYSRYVEWCQKQSVRPLGQVAFGTRMKQLGWDPVKASVNYYMGVRLRVDSDDVEDILSTSESDPSVTAVR